MHGQRVTKSQCQMLGGYDREIIEQQERHDQEISLIPTHPRNTIDHAYLLLYVKFILFILAQVSEACKEWTQKERSADCIIKLNT